LPTLPAGACETHIFPTLQVSLLSIGLLTDAGLTAIYTADTVMIQDPTGATVLSGTRSPSIRLWMIDLPAPEAKQSVIHHENDSQSLYNFITPLLLYLLSSKHPHECLPQLTVQKIRRNKPHTFSTSFDHLEQTRKNYKSTKPVVVPPPVATAPSTSLAEADTFPPCNPMPSNTQQYLYQDRAHA
jgi:hypothetical protein